jgi:hypothetical protein
LNEFKPIHTRAFQKFFLPLNPIMPILFIFIWWGGTPAVSIRDTLKNNLTGLLGPGSKRCRKDRTFYEKAYSFFLSFAWPGRLQREIDLLPSGLAHTLVCG